MRPGRVVDASQGAVAGAEVLVLTMGDPMPIGVMKTDGEGRFSAPVAAGAVLLVDAGYGRMQHVPWSAASEDEITIEVPALREVRGRIVGLPQVAGTHLRAAIQPNAMPGPAPPALVMARLAADGPAARPVEDAP